MRMKSIAAIAIATATLAGGTGVASAQEAGSNAGSSNLSSGIQLPQEVSDLLSFLPAAQAAQVEGAIQSTAGFFAVGLGSTAIGSTAVTLGIADLLSS